MSLLDDWRVMDRKLREIDQVIAQRDQALKERDRLLEGIEAHRKLLDPKVRHLMKTPPENVTSALYDLAVSIRKELDR